MANKYRNIIRPGGITSTTYDARRMVEDVNEEIRTLDEAATPLLTLSTYLKRGAKPINPKFQSIQYHGFSHRDYVISTVMGSTVGAQYKRFGRITISQPTRPDVTDSMIYQPQDKFFIVATGQTVEVVMTPYDSISTRYDNQGKLSLDVGVTGNTTSATAMGDMVVRSVTPEPLKSFTTSDIIFLGRSIYESQKIEAEGVHRDLIYDANFITHKERTMQMTEDQKEWIKSKGTKPMWEWEQTENMKDFKRDIENTLMYDVRNVDFTVPGRPKYSTQGLMNAIQTNVMYYNPDNVADWENLLGTFSFEHAFRYNPNGTKKIAICGSKFLYNFNQAFKDYRQVQGLAPDDKMVGLAVDSFRMPTGEVLKFITSDYMLPRNTPMENWCFVIDPKEMELKIVKDIQTKMYQGHNERDSHLMMEWKGGIAWHREQCMALLRTY